MLTIDAPGVQKRKASVVRERFTEDVELKRVLGRGKASAFGGSTRQADGKLGRAAHAHVQQALDDLVSQERTSFFFFHWTSNIINNHKTMTVSIY